MDFLWFVFAGTLSGVIAGMGMGGGTLLIPILTIFLGVGQVQSQLVNLLVFSVSAIVVLIIQSRNKLLDFSYWWIIALPACLVSFLGCLLAVKITLKVLKICFATLIFAVGLAQIIYIIIGWCKQH